MVKTFLIISLSQLLCWTPAALPSSTEQVKNKAKVVKTPPEIRDELEIKISSFLTKLVENSAAESNEYLQINLKKIADTAKESFAKSLKKNLRFDRSADALEWDFSLIWKQAINRVVEKEELIPVNSLDGELNDQFAVEESSSENTEPDTLEPPTGGALTTTDGTGETHSKPKAKAAKTITVKTVLLNLLMRQANCKDKPQKVRTIIEMGADKNLVDAFKSTPKMYNQKEYPLKIAIDEIKDEKDRQEIISILFDDTAIYTRNDILPGEKLETIKKTVAYNKTYLAEKLLEDGDYVTFAKLMDKAEEMGVQYVEDFTDEASQIHDQLYSPLLEKILAKMRDIRRLTYSSNREGLRVDNIKEFLNSKRMKRQMSLSSEARFSLSFQGRLQKDFESLFSKISQHIDETRTSSDLEGKNFKGNLLQWVALANFRNRVCKHLNKFALTASNNAKKSNVIRLIRLANTWDKDSEGTEEGDKFKELEEFGGKEIIFATKNKLRWTPSMYAMAQKQSEGIQLLLKQAVNKVTDVDGVGNNILHLAFPLPEQFFKGELSSESGNVLELIGSHMGSDDARSKTSDAIKAITLEKGIATDDKIIALTASSSSNFTPVALAASTGNFETYRFLKEFLQQNSAWNEDDHAYLGTHIEELLVHGLSAYMKAKQGLGTLSGAEKNQLTGTIGILQHEIDRKYCDSIHEIYQPEVQITVDRLHKIEKAAMLVIEDFYSKPATKRKVDPYKQSLEAAMEKMTSKKHNAFFADSILAGMSTSTSMVKASYLGPVVSKITKDFLAHKPTPKDMTFDKVYEGITGSNEKAFFAHHFNRTVENLMQKVILKAIVAEGRLREVAVEDDDHNRFKNVEEEYLSDKEDDDKDEEESASSTEAKSVHDHSKEWAF